MNIVVAPTLSARTRGGGGLGTDFECDGGLIPTVARALTTSNQRIDAETETLLPFAFDIAQITSKTNRSRVEPGPGPAPTLSKGSALHAVADTLTSHWHQSNGATAGNNAGVINPVFHGAAVRRLTPRECERLQGFPDDYTLINMRGKPAADGPRYKALGNSMAVPVMRWIGRRIERIEQLTSK